MKTWAVIVWEDIVTETILSVVEVEAEDETEATAEAEVLAEGHDFQLLEGSKHNMLKKYVKDRNDLRFDLPLESLPYPTSLRVHDRIIEQVIQIFGGMDDPDVKEDLKFK